MSVTFKKVVRGFDKFEVNSYIYDVETSYIEKSDAIENEVNEHKNILRKNNEKIKRLEDKIREASTIMGSIEKIDNELRLASQSILRQREESIQKVNEFYNEENKKAEETIQRLDEELASVRKEYEKLLSNIFDFTSSAFQNVHCFNVTEPCRDDSETLATDEISATEVQNDYEENILGKPLTGDIVDDAGKLIAAKGAIVDVEMLEILEDKNMLLELLKNV